MVKALRRNRVDLSLFQRQRPQRRPEVLAELRTRILIAIEDRQAGKHLVQLLAAKGYEGVRVVRRAESALFLAQQFSPGIVFLDVALTDDAYQLASDLRRQAGRRALRLIALTTSIEHSSREQARGAGFERWLVTPVVLAELDNLLAEEVTTA